MVVGGKVGCSLLLVKNALPNWLKLALELLM